MPRFRTLRTRRHRDDRPSNVEALAGAVIRLRGERDVSTIVVVGADCASA